MIRGLDHFFYEDGPRIVQSREEKAPKRSYYRFSTYEGRL